MGYPVSTQTQPRSPSGLISRWPSDQSPHSLTVGPPATLRLCSPMCSASPCRMHRTRVCSPCVLCNIAGMVRWSYCAICSRRPANPSSPGLRNLRCKSGRPCLPEHMLGPASEKALGYNADANGSPLLANAAAPPNTPARDRPNRRPWLLQTKADRHGESWAAGPQRQTYVWC